MGSEEVPERLREQALAQEGLARARGYAVAKPAAAVPEARWDHRELAAAEYLGSVD